MMNYQGMNGFQMVDYSQGWNPMVHDQMLQQKIEICFQRYDMNMSGQLEGQEFFYAYRDLCLMMGIAPPMNYQDVWNAVTQSDYNGNGRVSRIEMFMLFKRIQGIQQGQMFNNWNQGGMGWVWEVEWVWEEECKWDDVWEKEDGEHHNIYYLLFLIIVS